jgi:outer membrane protein TolC
MKYNTTALIRLRSLLLLAVISLMGLSACSPLKTKHSEAKNSQTNNFNNLQTKLKQKIAKIRSATNITANRLHKEANDYRYSSYVQHNLKARQLPPATTTRYATRNSRVYQTQLQQLSNNKKRSRSRIAAVIIHNGLYTPSTKLQQQLSSLKGNRSPSLWLEATPSLNATLALALKNNLDIKSQQQNALTNLSKYDQVSYLDDMLLQYSAFTNDITLTGSSQKHNRSASSGFPFPALRALKASIINQSVEISRLKLKQTVQNIITQTRLAYYQLQFSQHNIELTQQMGKLLHSLKQELTNDYSVNAAKLGDILQIDIEMAENKNDVHLAKDKQQAQQARLNALLNLPTHFRLSQLDPLTPLSLSVSSLSLIQTAQQKRIEIATLNAQVEKMQRVIRLSERRFYPDFDAGYSRFQNSMSKQVGNHAKRTAFSNRPKIKSSNFFATNDAYLTETKDKVTALQAKIKALKTQTADDLQQATTRYQSQQRNYVLYQDKILPKALAALEIAKNNFETGEGSFMGIMQAQEAIFRYRLLRFKAIKDMNMMVAKIRRIMGE